MKIGETETVYVDEKTDIANMFNQYFASIFTKDQDGSFEQKDISHNIIPIIDNVTLSEEDIVAVIKNLDSNKAQGPDGIRVRLLKETAMQIAPSL